MKLKNKTYIKNIPTLKDLLDLMRENCSEHEYRKWCICRIPENISIEKRKELLNTDVSGEVIGFQNQHSTWTTTWNLIVRNIAHTDWKVIDYSKLRKSISLDIE